MTTEQKVALTGNVHLIISLATLVSVLASAFFLGGKYQELCAHIKGDWCTVQQARWVGETERLNPEWKAADVWRIHNETTGGKVE